ncbi:MAG: [FeFe] hydrogenase, group A [Clostridia bacterium]|nr:[FeFe] hydrogenase, group A [Clostridia bacterium]
MKKMINLKINNIPVTVPEGTTILQAAKMANIEIPSLCYLKDVNCIGACRVCVVEIVGRRGLVASCVYPVEEGMEVLTNTPAVRASRKTTIELILSTHHKKCLSCVRGNNCELQKLAYDYAIDEDRFKGEEPIYKIDDSAPYVVRDNNKCIQCLRCVATCNKVQSVGAIGQIRRGFDVHVGSPFDIGLASTSCVGCGQCIVSCPVGALYEKSNIDQVWDAIADPSKKVVFFTAPSIAATLGECFGMPVGTNVEGKMVNAIKMLGNVEVYNMNLTADLTIMEEANELLDRLKTDKPIPMFTSCCPGWIKFCEHNYPELLPNLSTCKSPQEMFGALLKSYYCQKNNIDPKDMFVVSVIPCTAKKFEVSRPELSNAGIADVDVAITTRELSRMIKGAGIAFKDIPDAEFDNPFAVGSGAGAIFGASGGVMEAALRTAANILDGTNEKLEFMDVRGMSGIKEATYKIAGTEVDVCVASGLANARKVIEMIKSGEKKYLFVEIMACPGGCINGGGQPVQSDSVRNYSELKSKRASVLYNADKEGSLRLSHENPIVQSLYDDYLEAPGKAKAHSLLHTTYTARKKY